MEKQDEFEEFEEFDDEDDDEEGEVETEEEEDEDEVKEEPVKKKVVKKQPVKEVTQKQKDNYDKRVEEVEKEEPPVQYIGVPRAVSVEEMINRVFDELQELKQMVNTLLTTK